MGNLSFSERLLDFGLTRQEAAVYECLLEEGKRTGYEVSKITGISRSNIYSSLASLKEKGAIYLVEEGNVKKYVPLPIDEFCGNYIRKISESAKWLADHAPEEKVEETGYITIEGVEHIQDKVRNLLLHAEERVYLSCTVQYLPQFEKELNQLQNAGKKVVVITDGEPEACSGTVYIGEEKGTQIGVIADSRYVLTGELGKRSLNTCLYSGQRNFVEVYKRALSNEIKFIEFMKGETE